jgi:RNA polymerase sigma-70 factor (ECF subfamily)
MKALEKIEGFDNKKGTFQAWIYKIARNTVIDHYRTRKVDTNIEDVWDLSSGEDLDRDLDVKQKLEHIEKYLVKLKSEQRDIIIMRIWQGMSYREISEVLGKSEDSCKMMFSRVIKKLREEMPLVIFLALLLFK